MLYTLISRTSVKIGRFDRCFLFPDIGPDNCSAVHLQLLFEEGAINFLLTLQKYSAHWATLHEESATIHKAGTIKSGVQRTTNVSNFQYPPIV